MSAAARVMGRLAVHLLALVLSSNTLRVTDTAAVGGWHLNWSCFKHQQWLDFTDMNAPGITYCQLRLTWVQVAPEGDEE